MTIRPARCVRGACRCRGMKRERIQRRSVGSSRTTRRRHSPRAPVRRGGGRHRLADDALSCRAPGEGRSGSKCADHGDGVCVRITTTTGNSCRRAAVVPIRAGAGRRIANGSFADRLRRQAIDALRYRGSLSETEGAEAHATSLCQGLPRCRRASRGPLRPVELIHDAAATSAWRTSGGSGGRRETAG
jgi:hypothetical protein